MPQPCLQIYLPHIENSATHSVGCDWNIQFSFANGFKMQSTDYFDDGIHTVISIIEQRSDFCLIYVSAVVINYLWPTWPAYDSALLTKKQLTCSAQLSQVYSGIWTAQVFADVGVWSEYVGSTWWEAPANPAAGGNPVTPAAENRTSATCWITAAHGSRCNRWPVVQWITYMYTYIRKML